jgi:16S rRNA (cytosine967-C5)-methyltransferase
MPVSPARAAAFDILLRVETTDAYASELLHSSRTGKLSPSDHGLATEIVMGVLRWRSVLDEQVAGHVNQRSSAAKAANNSGTPPARLEAAPSRKDSLSKLDPEVITALRIGAYQLRFLDRIPAHAAINESVELVKKARKRSAAGMVNAVLRKISARSSALRSLANQDPLRAHPAWLVQRWERTYGIEATQAICSYNQTTPHTVVRADETLVEQLAAEAIQLEPGRLLKQAHTVTAGDITRTRAFRDKRLTIQDEGSQLIALLVGNGERILDCCAAPGGKTRIVAEQNPNSTVIATELHPHRAALMKRLVPLDKVHLIAGDIRTTPFSVQFDRILVDAPCTGTGTLARNPEIKWRLKPEDISRLQAYQIEILTAATQKLAPGGQLLYSTCSLEPEENEAVIEQALRGDSSVRLLNIRDRLTELHKEGVLVCDPDWLIQGSYLRTIPGVHPCDGFFAALLERKM